MSKSVQIIALAGLLSLSTIAGYLLYSVNQSGAPENAETDPAVPVVTQAEQLNSFILDDPDGVPTKLGSWHGKPQIINYWATWCAPCREEIPLLVSLQDEYASDDLVVIGLSMDFPEDLALVQAFVKEQAIDYPILMAAEVGSEIASLYGTNNFVLPISIFVRANGEVSGIHTGVLKAEQARKMIREIL